MHIPIKLKLGTHKELIKAHYHTNFGWNPVKIYGVKIDFSREKGRRSVTPTGRTTGRNWMKLGIKVEYPSWECLFVV